MKNNKKKSILILILIVLCIILSLLFSIGKGGMKENKTKEIEEEKIQVERVRKAAVSGRFYPSDEETLRRIIKGYIENAKEEKIRGRIRGLVSPHAGYIFSGKVAAYGYKELLGGRYREVFILGPSHYVGFKEASIANATHYETPLGKVRLSERVDDLRREPLIISNEFAHLREHSLEVQIPFLQEVLDNFTIIPIVTGDVDPEELAEVLLRYIDDDSLVIASSDLSHYHPYEKAIELDKNCITSIPNLNFNEMINKCEACGKIPILTLMYIAREKGWEGKLLNYNNSGDTYGNKDRVVGYSSIAFYEKMEEEIGEKDRKFLLELARKTLEGYLKNGSKPGVDEGKIPEKLKEMKGCFVTLEKNHQLRGCIGHILPQKRLYECVIENAINAALNDPRFPPVRYEELKDIEIEISVLSVPKKLDYSSSEDLLEKLTPLRDGVILKSGWRQATYLPQVWEQIPRKEDFLSSLCRKGYMPGDCWRKGETEVYVYRAQVFREE